MISKSVFNRLRVSNYSSIVALEALCLPDWHIDGVDSIANSCHNSGNDQLHASGCRCLQNGSSYHDPASPHDTPFPAITISSQECHDCTYETANVIDGGYDAFELGAWIVEVGAKRRQANDSTKDTLIIAKELVTRQSVLRRTCLLSKHSPRTRGRYWEKCAKSNIRGEKEIECKTLCQFFYS